MRSTASALAPARRARPRRAGTLRGVGCGALLASTLLSACSGSEGTTARAADAFDCTWVADPGNCWRAMAASVEGCLGGDPPENGRFAPDALSCTYAPFPREVVSSIPLGSQDAGPTPTRDFVVTQAGVECVRVRERDHVLTVTYAGGTVTLDTREGQLSLTCPSGAVFQGPEVGLRSCLSPASGIPGYSWASALGEDGRRKNATFALTGVRAPLFACRQ